MTARCCSVLVLFLIAAQHAAAESARLEIHPASLPAPAMKHRLIPSAAEQTPGNAATLYLSAFAAAGEITGDGAFQRLKSAELKDLGTDQTRQFLDKYANVIEQLVLAGRRDHCQWDPPTRKQGLNTDLSYLSRAQVMIDLLRIKARLHTAHQGYDQAMDTLQTAFALAHNLNQPPVFQAVVAAGLEAALLEDVRELIRQPGSPNLYWALANLPSADEQQQRVVESESLFSLFPQLKHPEHLSAEESRGVLNTLSGIVRADERGEWNLSLVLTLVRTYPDAKKQLVESGIPLATVESMPANSVVLAYFVADYRRRADELEKWAGLPLWQAWGGAERATRELDEAGRDANPLLSILPRHNELLHFAQVERQRAILEIIEGIRAYAAAHGGALPGSLNEISAATPVPLDPFLARPFDYSSTGTAATLHAGVPTDLSPLFESTYVITIAR